MNKIYTTLLIFSTCLIHAIPPQIDDIVCDLNNCEFCRRVSTYREPFSLADLINKCIRGKNNRRAKVVDTNKTAPEPVPKSIVNQLKTPDDLPDVSSLQQQIQDKDEEILSLKQQLKNQKNDIDKHVDAISRLERQVDILEKRKPVTMFDGWVWDPQELGWTYVNPSIVPYIYTQDKGWMKYESGTKPRLFYVYRDKVWIELK